jgi:hypothetical protein
MTVRKVEPPQQRPIPQDVRAELRKVIREASWTKASSAAYKNSPHHYIIAMRCGPEWRWFYGIIRDYGVYRTWHGHKYKYLVLDRKCYWVDFPALNRADVDTLD